MKMTVFVGDNMTGDFGLVFVAFFSALFFMLIHFFSPKIHRSLEPHKDKVFSLLGGITAAYVFVDLLPRLEETGNHIEKLFASLPDFVYYVAAPTLAFLGFLVFFGLEHLAISSRERENTQRTFFIHLGNVVLINLIIGYLLRFEAQIGIFALGLYSVVLSLHFITLDESLEDHYRKLYSRIGRYIAGAAPMIGWIISIFFPENQSEGYLFLAIVTGSVLFISIKNEIPSADAKTTKTFFMGALFTTILLFIVAWLRV